LFEGNDEIIKYYVETNTDLKRYIDIDHSSKNKIKIKIEVP
jgi:hypothetical protein